VGFFGYDPPHLPLATKLKGCRNERVPRKRAKVAIYFIICVVSRHRKGVLDIAYLLGNEIPGVSADE